jgi:hypothetical protein
LNSTTRAYLTQHGQRQLHVEDGTISTDGNQELTVAAVHNTTTNVHAVAYE